MDNTQGTDPLEGGSGMDGGWVLLEATDVDGAGGDDDEDEDEDYGEDFTDFIDDCAKEFSEETHTSLFSQQQIEEDDRAVQALKRKFLESPKSKVDSELSPRLAAISLVQRTGKAKKRLYRDQTQDSGHGNSEESGATEVVVSTQVQKGGLQRVGQTPVVVRASTQQAAESAGSQEDYTGRVTQLLRSAQPRCALLGIFKELFACSFMDLTRCFKSDSTAGEDWVCFVGGVPCSLADGVVDLMAPHVLYSHITSSTCSLGIAVLMLVRWKTAKTRATVKKLLGSLLAVESGQMLLEPPRLRNPAAAMFWYKKAMCNSTVVTGETPQWILREVSIQDQVGEQCLFSLSDMVQWAYDNGIETESAAAYEYALLADEDKNADAFLRSNQQAKWVGDCMRMVRLYRRAEMNKMTMGQWIKHRSEKTHGEGNWKEIFKFLKFQGIEITSFLTYFRLFLKGVPKKNCIAICGPPNTGKSLFGMSLIDFIDGRVISHCNSNSHFWLQPLTECKLALLDDATPPTWDYFDTYLRNLADGNPVSVDTKHRAPTQMKCPPLLITTNTDISQGDRWTYLKSRIKVFTFPEQMPLTEMGDPAFALTRQNWKSFFQRCWSSLGLEDPEQEAANGDPREVLQPLRCTARRADGLS
ncbi:E1 protein [Phocoena phocoena papillomavirus 1]|uniref:Replication protein E1 n=1 Tax=Phocoena phocoena papillomavirus 1 TaxID=706525 RepID=F2VIQ7_PSPV|nr:E1 protein [Phocoena phocoena papillomavirus 1]ADJ96342.1 E1 protein [Phocoena phocoena papillomavirus 1]